VAIVPAPTVDPPEPLGLRYGLLTAAAGPLDLPSPGGFGGGVTYDPVSCGGAHRLDMACLAEDPEDRPVKTFDPADTWVEAAPFVTYASLTCGAVGYPGDRADAKVRRRLFNGEQSQVEQHLGIVLSDDATPVATGDPTEIRSVVGSLEQWLYGGADDEQGYGSIGFLHMPLRFAALTDFLGLRRDEGGRYRTKLNTVVVFGDYPDNGSVFITGHVTTYRAPEPSVAPRSQVLNRVTNQLYMLAEREWAVAYDCAAGVATFTGGGVS
jgi:hypothetical protein